MYKIFFSLLLSASLPRAVFAAGQPTTLTVFSKTIVKLADDIAGILFALALVGFLWGVVLMVKGKMVGEKDNKTMIGKKIMINGLIGLFVIASLWSILYLVRRTFFGV